MKAILQPYFYDFWLTSGTLLGWYRECGIIPYTSDVDFGMRASDVKSLESILQLFRKSRSLKLVMRYGLVEEALELTLDYKGLKMDIFFFYKEGNQSYVACHYRDSNSYAKVLYPPFSLCSAALLGEKVLVPCETETILKTEYGPNWTQPISKWDWKNSFFNKGPEIHWENNKKKQVYEQFMG
ncbi:ribitol-5-phosphate transferase FKTN-like [Argiope bruennichi]|uniref:ribitol-5-phosphate transferase FKTN-like n=1 Tax=Argiope bruennichi TaxID=94029 RepID=UPI002493F792|nr:ribitol-5-phosphate transferase FKTN-like [Argiope bruennichi]